MNRELSFDFTIELLKACLTNEKVLSICSQYVKYQYLSAEPYKKVFKFVFESYGIGGKIPTLGIIQQTFNTDTEIVNILVKVKKIIIDPSQYDDIISTLEIFIKDSRFRILYDRIGDLYNEGKRDQAIKLLAEEAEAINEFKLKESYYTTIFKGFERRQEKRQQGDVDGDILREKCTFGIHELDDLTQGGPNKGTSVLFTARSGVGKSTVLRWMGLCNARLGKRVVHFQVEGSEQEVIDAYDAGWTSISLQDIEFGIIPESKKVKIEKARRDIMANGGEIFVYASESFDQMTIEDCRDIMMDIVQIYGPIDLALFDYLEEIETKQSFGGSESGERRRREKVGKKITNLAIEFKCVTATATQANDISPDKYNNDEFVITRTNISEFKGSIKPFSYHLTLNQTDDEYDKEIIRIHVDKFRKYKRPAKPIYIYQSRANGRFYNAHKTLTTFYETR